MITKNGNILLGKINPTSSSAWLLTNGQILSSNNGITPNRVINYTPYLVIGSGNAQPTIEDFNLENPINNVTRIVNSISSSVDMNSDFSLCVQSLFKNETNEDIIVKEVGIMSDCGSNRYILLSREVLQTPIIIKPNKTYAFSIVI